MESFAASLPFLIGGTAVLAAGSTLVAGTAIACLQSTKDYESGTRMLLWIARNFLFWLSVVAATVGAGFLGKLCAEISHGVYRKSSRAELDDLKFRNTFRGSWGPTQDQLPSNSAPRYKLHIPTACVSLAFLGVLSSMIWNTILFRLWPKSWTSKCGELHFSVSLWMAGINVIFALIVAASI